MLGLLGLSGFKMAIIGAVLAAVATVVGGLYWWNSVLRADLRISEANNATLTLAVETQKGAVIAAQENAKEWKRANENLQKQMEELARVSAEASKESKRLAVLWAKHPFTADALARPGMVERRVDRGSRIALGVLHTITAGDLREPSGAGETAGATGSTQPPADSN